MKFRQMRWTIRQLAKAVEGEELDLQPNFQRGEVWSEPKKQRLVDSVLRHWYVPPIHIIESGESSRYEVLDGQQRLRALLDFRAGVFAVDGNIDPEDKRIRRLHGRTYSELPSLTKRRYDSFKISVFALTDHEPSEPGELFFRLNQPATLTGAEQRNAFFGSAREQVKTWVRLMGHLGINKDVLGFSNARMAYNDTLARAALTIEHGTLAKKVTADDLVSVFRSTSGYSRATDREMQRAIRLFADGARRFSVTVRFNKATLYSWLIFLVRAERKIPDAKLLPIMAKVFGEFAGDFTHRLRYLYEGAEEQEELFKSSGDARLLAFFQDRATSRVADVSSVVVRDIVLWIYFGVFLRSNEKVNASLTEALRPLLRKAERVEERIVKLRSLDEEVLGRIAEEMTWEALA